VSTTSGHTRDTGDGTSGTPGLGAGLVTNTAAYGVGDTSILGDVGVHELHDIISRAEEKTLGRLAVFPSF